MKRLIIAALLCVSSVTYGQAVGGNGVPGAGGGGGGTPAGVSGNPQINAAGSFGASSNVIAQLPGDTIASIEAACSSLCTYVVTSPQTITLAASHAMNSNVWLRFEADGAWNVTGAFTLSNVQVAPGTTSTQHFSLANSAVVTLSTRNTLVPVEWFGAIGDWNGTTGTNNLTAIQNTLNSITYGQAQLSAPYAIGGTLTIPANYVGINGINVGRGGYRSGLIETVAGDDALDDIGASAGAPRQFGIFSNFFIESSVAQTGTPAGLNLSFTGGVIAKNLLIQDFFYPVSAHSSPSYGGIGLTGITASWSTLSSGMTSPVCFYLPSTDGNAENSLTLSFDACAAPASGGPTSPIALEINGTAVNDINVNNFATAFTNGPEVFFTGTGSGATCSDIHFINMTVDNFLTYGAEVSGCTATQTGSVEFSGGWDQTGPNTAGGGGSANFYILNSSGVSINHMQLGGHAGGNHAAQFGINIAGGSGNSVVGNTILNQPFAVSLTNSTTWNAVVGNTITNSTGGNINVAMQINNSAGYNIINDNIIAGANTWTTGLSIASGSNNNVYVGNNCGSGVTTCISDSGTGNGIGSVTATKVTIAPSAATAFTGMLTVNTTNLSTPQNYYGVSSIGPINFVAANLAAPTSDYSFGFGLPAGTPGTNFVLGGYNGSSWLADITVNPSTQATTFGGSINPPAARKGTFVCTAGGTITITNANELVTSDVVISLNTAGGTISTAPAMKTVTSGTGFTVLCGAADTSTYNYDILN